MRDEKPSLKKVSDLVEIAGTLRASRVVVAGGDRPEDLRLVESARDHGILDRILLVGDSRKIRSAVSAVGIEIPESDIIPAENDESTAAATASLMSGREADIVLKGNISTPIINRHLLPFADRDTVGLTTLFDAAPISQGRPMLLTDAGVTTVCNFGRMCGLIRNAVDVAHLVMEVERPRVAILSANEKQIPSLPSTRMGADLSERRWRDAVVYGPLSFDLATDLGSVETKGLPDRPGARDVAGKADVLVCPGIDTANAVYKMITAMVKYGQASMACITMGFPIPYIILSRSDALSTRLESIALCSVYIQRLRGGTRDAWCEGKTEGILEDRRIVRVEGMGGTVAVKAVVRGETVDEVTVPMTDGEGGVMAVAKAVGSMFVVAGTDVEEIVLSRTWGDQPEALRELRKRVGRLAPVRVDAGKED